MRMCSLDNANAMSCATIVGGAQVPSPHMTCAWLAATSWIMLAMLTMLAVRSGPTS